MGSEPRHGCTLVNSMYGEKYSGSKEGSKHRCIIDWLYPCISFVESEL